MAEKVEEIFIPGTGIDIVFNMNSLTPRVKPSFIFECLYPKNRMIISQTLPRIRPDAKFDQMTLTTLTRDESQGKKRFGVNCTFEKFLATYQLANKTSEPAILVNYQLPVIEANVRNAFRLQPNQRFEIIGKMIYNQQEYYSGKEIKIHDISISGLGILIPKIINKTKNPLLKIAPATPAKIGLVLRDLKSDDKGTIINCTLEVIRVNLNFSEHFAFAGFKYTKIAQRYEELLSKYIHEAQLYDIRQHQHL